MGKKELNLFQEPKLIVYDSGIGGKSIFNKCKKFFKNSVFFQDSENFPYGNKTFQNLSEIFLNNIKNFSLKENDILILACNTISCVYFDLLIDLKINYKVISILDYVLQSQTEDSVIICTNYTSDFLNKLNVKNLALSDLADLIEKNYTEDILKFLSNIIINEKNVIYGCTHYPIADKLFKKRYSDKIFINPEQKLIIDIKKNIKLIKC